MGRVRKGHIPSLSKSRFMAGLQCHKRLYLECFSRDLADPVGEGQQAIFDAGTEVGQLARGLYPGGALVTEDHLHHDDAVESTNSLLADPGLPAIFEAAFRHDDIKIRADVLARADDDSFDLIEFKSSTQVKEEHIPDVCVQVYVLNGCGIKVGRACIGHLNNEYVYQGGACDLRQLFRVEDITEQVRRMLPQIPTLLDAMRRPLHSAEPPDIKAGRQCSTPYECSFFGHCHADQPEHSVDQLPRASEKLLRSLADAGIEDIRCIPADFRGLNAIQERVRDCVVHDRAYLSESLERHLERFEYPVHFLDFETFNPALPIYVGTHPYQVIPFQWSDHILERSGQLRHEQFLHEGSDDPRESFIESLLRTLGTKGSIVVYTSFEATRVRELAAAFPAYSTGLLGLLDSRIVDLYQLIKTHCYYPNFHGSFSIKSVLPALVPELGYDDLEINDGGMASIAFAEMRRPETPSERRRSLKDNLLKYCQRDTEAEVWIFQTLRGS